MELLRRNHQISSKDFTISEDKIHVHHSADKLMDNKWGEEYRRS
jgi:hypothetical protein